MPPAILAQPGGHVLRKDAQSVPLAVVESADHSKAEVVLPAVATLLLYTDGLVERRSHPINTGMTQVAEVLLAHREHSPDALADLLIERIVDRGHDDVAFLLYRRGSHGRRCTVSSRSSLVIVKICGRMPTPSSTTSTPRPMNA